MQNFASVPTGKPFIAKYYELFFLAGYEYMTQISIIFTKNKETC
jgi:hypothetical protein